MKGKLCDLFVLIGLLSVVFVAIFLIRQADYVEYRFYKTDCIEIRDTSVVKRSINKADYSDEKLFDIEKSNFRLVFKKKVDDSEKYTVYVSQGEGIKYYIYNSKLDKYGVIGDGRNLIDFLHHEMDKYLDTIG